MKSKLTNDQRRTLTTKKHPRRARGFQRTLAIGIIALAICCLVQPTLAKPGKAVTRPLKGEGHITMVVDPITGDYEFVDWGVATHAGRFTNAGAGVINLATGEFISGTGLVFAANGDTLEWVVGDIPNTVVYTGGTGRFEGVTGGFVGTITSTTLLSVNPDGTLTLAITYDANGSISY